MVIIGLTGPAGCGKDTVADHLASELGYARYAFADPLRAALVAGLGIDPACFTNRDLKEKPHVLYGVSPRRMLQTLGTEWGRKLIADDVWLRRAALFAHQAARKGSKALVISDVRFENEAAWVRKQGLLLHIHRPDVGAVETHASEAGVSFVAGADARIENTSTVQALCRQASIIVRAYCAWQKAPALR